MYVFAKSCIAHRSTTFNPQKDGGFLPGTPDISQILNLFFERKQRHRTYLIAIQNTCDYLYGTIVHLIMRTAENIVPIHNRSCCKELQMQFRTFVGSSGLE